MFISFLWQFHIYTQSEQASKGEWERKREKKWATRSLHMLDTSATWFFIWENAKKSVKTHTHTHTDRHTHLGYTHTDTHTERANEAATLTLFGQHVKRFEVLFAALFFAVALCCLRSKAKREVKWGILDSRMPSKMWLISLKLAAHVDNGGNLHRKVKGCPLCIIIKEIEE